MKNCPKCNGKLGKNYLAIGDGCSFCKPKCNYCGVGLKDFEMYHLKDCKVFNKLVEKEKHCGGKR